MSNRILLSLQLAGTLVILAFVPGNVGKLLAFLVLWSLTFKSVSKREMVFYLIICSIFTFMNALSLKQGIFVFKNPDILGMPFYELFMWGFYLLHTARLINGSIPKSQNKQIGILALLFSAAFGIISDQSMLLYATAGLVGTCLLLHHEKLDLLYVFYMIALGALIEYTGVWTDQWAYPGKPIGGVPLWFITLWGGVGFFLRRLALPMIYSSKLESQK